MGGGGGVVLGRPIRLFAVHNNFQFKGAGGGGGGNGYSWYTPILSPQQFSILRGSSIL